jgi:hypothetical protein
VSLSDFQEARARFSAVTAGKPHDELMSMMPRENSKDTEKLAIETCHTEMSNCPNVLITTT